MIGGLLVDAMVLAAVAAFGWAGLQLGGRASIARLVAAYAAFGLAALLRDPIGSVIEAALGTSEDFSRLASMVIVGVGAYIATTSVVTWGLRRRAPDEAEADIEEAPVIDRFDDPRLVAGAGAVLGCSWVVLFVGLLVLLPSDTPVSRAAVDSWSGGRLIEQERALRWFAEGFPHYTQTLPKGEDGVVVGERASLPMRGGEAPTSRGRDADIVFDAINGLRLSRRVRTLAFNPDLAAVARRHALVLASDRSLSYRTTGGGSLDDRVRASLGASSGAFRAEVGIEVAWAHSPANAGVGLVENSRAANLLSDTQWSEVGVGTADAGWFDGRIYVVLLIGPEETVAGADPSGPASGDAGGAAAAGTLPSDEVAPAESESLGCDDGAIDIDGDGVPDPQSVDPSLQDCPASSGS